MKYTDDKCRVCGANEYHELTYSRPSRECMRHFQKQAEENEQLKKNVGSGKFYKA